MAAAGSVNKEIEEDRTSARDAENQPYRQQQTKRGLSPRHVQLMMIAGAIGIGLFVGVGGVLRKAGPLPLIIGYIIYGVGFIYPTSLAVAEMLAWLPLRGSIYELAARYVDPALGFAMGWTYFFAGAMLVCTEYSAVATVIQFWNTSVNPAVWVAIVMVVCVLLNLVAVKWYGESEFVMSSTKILLLTGLVLATIITMAGGNPNHDAYGFRNWSGGNFVHSYYAEGATGIFLSICVSVRYAGFTVAGPDILALAAAEMRNPRKTIPSVAKVILYRIVGVYIVGIVAVGIICSSRDPRLMGAIDSGEAGAAASPWVLGLMKRISGFLPGFINALIMLSGWSCGNAYLYSSSRTLYSLAQDGKAPKILLKCTKSGAPWVCVMVVSAISCLAFLVASNSTIEVFNWFVDLTTVSLVVNATAMSWVFLGWRRALMKKGIPLIGKNHFKAPGRLAKLLGRKSQHPEVNDETIIFPYVAPGGWFFPYTSLLLGSCVCFFIGFDVFCPFSYRGFITSYFGLVWFFGMFAFWKVFKRTRFVNAADVDIFAGGLKQEIDDECRHWEEGADDTEKASHSVQNWVRKAFSKPAV
uniref:Amino acid permease/ SLC12A domain-containing protein n=1 Tax=Bionectria ochroleuca TaxID=29856 RepID=A0A0B7KA37_BIOOC